LTIGLWGVFADRYSNKTIIAICAPLYLCCVIAWCFVGIYTNLVSNLALLAMIHIGSGASNAGINLALTNIGLKLAPSKEAIVYLSVKNIITSVFSSLAPFIGGYLADYYTLRQLRVIAEWSGPSLQKTFRLLLLHEWNFLFLIGAVLTVVAIQLLPRVMEAGEVNKNIVRRILRTSIRSNLQGLLCDRCHYELEFGLDNDAQRQTGRLAGRYSKISNRNQIFNGRHDLTWVRIWNLISIKLLGNMPDNGIPAL
jgi:MFS family permease